MACFLFTIGTLNRQQMRADDLTFVTWLTLDVMGRILFFRLTRIKANLTKGFIIARLLGFAVAYYLLGFAVAVAFVRTHLLVYNCFVGLKYDCLLSKKAFQFFWKILRNNRLFYVHFHFFTKYISSIFCNVVYNGKQSVL